MDCNTHIWKVFYRLWTKGCIGSKIVGRTVFIKSLNISSDFIRTKRFLGMSSIMFNLNITCKNDNFKIMSVFQVNEMTVTSVKWFHRRNFKSFIT